MANAFGIITSSAEHKVNGMQDIRPIGGFNFLGRFCVVDFPVSNFSNSGIEEIQVYNAAKPRSLTAHLGDGRHHNLNVKRGGIELLFPTEENLNTIYNTNIRAFLENIEYIKRKHQEYVVIAPSCMVFVQDYDSLLKEHIASGADISLLYHKVSDATEGYATCNDLLLDGDRVVKIKANTGSNAEENIFMESFVMKKDLLIDLIYEAAGISSRMNLTAIVDLKADSLDVRAIEHKGFFAPITDLKSYYKSNLSLLDAATLDTLFDEDWPIYTQMTDSWPTELYATADVKNSYICNSGEIKGNIYNSVVGRGVKVAEGATIKNCVCLSYVELGEGAYVENQVIDKYAKIGAGEKIIGDPENPSYIKYRDKI